MVFPWNSNSNSKDTTVFPFRLCYVTPLEVIFVRFFYSRYICAY